MADKNHQATDTGGDENAGCQGPGDDPLAPLFQRLARRSDAFLESFKDMDKLLDDFIKKLTPTQHTIPDTANEFAAKQAEALKTFKRLKAMNDEATARMQQMKAILLYPHSDRDSYFTVIIVDIKFHGFYDLLRSFRILLVENDKLLDEAAKEYEKLSPRTKASLRNGEKSGDETKGT